MTVDVRRPGWARLSAAAAALFPAPSVAVPIRGRHVALGIGAVVAGTGLMVLRQPGIGALDTVWAEDGSVFLTDATNKSPLGALATSYAGYYHLTPRLLAGIAVLFPASAAAAVLAVAAAVCVAAAAVLVYVASAGHLSTPLARVLAAGIVVLVPVGWEELPNAIANLHWYGLYVLFWMLLWSPAGRVGRIVGTVVVVLAAGSDILVLAFLPLAALRWYVRRDRYSAVLGGLLTLAVAVQVSGLLTGSSSRTLAPNPARAVIGYGVRAVPAAVLGQRAFPAKVNVEWLALAALAWVLVAVAVLVALRSTAVRPQWTFAAVATVYSVVLYVLPVTLSGVATPRYAAAPAMLVVAVLAALLAPRTGSLTPLWTVAVVLAVVCAVNFRVDNERAHGPSWHDELARARQACAGEVSTVDVPVAPATVPPSWFAHLPCRYAGR